MAQTRIVATVGPSSDNPDTLREMVKNGLSAVRINTAHTSEGYITRIKGMVDAINTQLGSSVGVMIDLKGPELRTGTFNGGSFSVEKGKEYRLTPESSNGDIRMNYASVFKSIRPSDEIVMSDGRVKFTVSCAGDAEAVITAQNSGSLRDRSRVNIPGRYLDLGVLTDRDIMFLDEGVRCGAEFYALSFVQDKSNVTHLQKLLYERSSEESAIVSKIETKQGFSSIAEICEVSDYIMVARGDLGVEMPLEDVVIAQKSIIEEAHRHGVPTIVATQMLESMVENATPTRAEVSDVTNAILDNADAIMLSEETAIGKHPGDAVHYMKKIAEYVEGVYRDFPEPAKFYGNRVAYSIAKASRVIAGEIDANAILAFTLTGNTARMISAVRPDIPIYAAVTSGRVGRSLNLLRGVIPIVMPERFRKTRDVLEAVSYIEGAGYFSKGDRVVVTSGAPYFLFGGTNDVRALTVGTFAGRGYPMGESVQGKVTLDQEGSGDIVIISDRKWNRESVTSRFRGIIFTIDIPDEDKDYLSHNNITVLFNTKLVAEIEEGGSVSVDGGTGIIIM